MSECVCAREREGSGVPESLAHHSVYTCGEEGRGNECVSL